MADAPSLSGPEPRGADEPSAEVVGLTLPRARDSNAALSLKRTIALVVVAMIGFAATTWTIRQAVSLTSAYRNSDLSGLRVSRVLSDPAVDVLFVGTSRTEIMVDPDRFDAMMSAGGHPTHSYVAALPSMAVPEIEPLLRDILDGGARHLKIVFIEPDFASLLPATMTATERSIHFFTSLDNTLSMLRFIDVVGRDTSDGTQASFVANTLAWVSIAHLNIGLVHYIFDRPLLDGPANVRRSRGYYSFDEVHYPNFLNSTGSEQDYQNIVTTVVKAYRGELDFTSAIADRQWDYFARTVRMLKRRGLQVVLLHAPQGGHLSEGIAWARGYQTRCIPGVPLFDFADPDQYPAFWDVRYRYDTDHLNSLGVPLYTAAIAEQMLAFIANGAASACATR